MELRLSLRQIPLQAQQQEPPLAATQVVVYDPTNEEDPQYGYAAASVGEALIYLLSEEGKGKVLEIRDPVAGGAVVSLLRSTHAGRDRMMFCYLVGSIQPDWSGDIDVELDSRDVEELRSLADYALFDSVTVHIAD